ncbi:MAG: TolC family outer membrane protein [Pseudoxanthomonas sp.]
MSRRPLFLALALPLSLLATHAGATDLMQTYELARTGDTTLSISESTALIDKESKVQARAALLPQLSGSASLGQSHSIEPSSPAGDGRSRKFGVSLGQTIFDWSSIANLRASSAIAKAADYDLASANSNLIVRTSASYFDVLIGIESLAAAETNEAAAKKQYDYAQKRLDVGLAPITDVHEARAEYDSARANTILARNALDDSYRALTELTGQPIANLQALPDDFRPELPSAQSAQDWVEHALAQNPDLKSAEYNLESAQHNVSSARGGHYPSLDLSAGWSKSSNWWENGLYSGDDSRGTSIGLSLSVPIFSGGATQSRVRSALARRDQAQDGLEATRRTLVRNTSSAYQALVAGVSEVEARRLAVVSAQSAYDASQVGLEVGTRTVLDVLQNQRALFQAQVNYASSKYQFLQNRLLLEQAAGSLDVQDVQDVNRLLTVSADAKLSSGLTQ